MKKDSYFSVNLPNYFNYLLDYSINIIGKKRLIEKNHIIMNSKYSNIPDINFILQMNKTKEFYKRMTLIQTLLYVDLVNLLTEKENWSFSFKKIYRKN